MLFDGHRLARQRHHLIVVDAEAATVGQRHIHGLHRLAGAGIAGVDHLDQLGTQVTSQHRRTAGRQGGLVDVELVRVHRALHHGLAEAPGRGHEHRITEAGLGIQGEHHAAGTGLGAHHLLHAGRQRHVLVGIATVHSVGNRAVVEQRGEHLVHRPLDVVVAFDIEEGFLLAGEGRVGKILGGSGTAHRHLEVGVLAEHQLVGFTQGGLEGRRQRGIDDPLANLAASLGKGVDVIDVETRKLLVDSIVEPLVGEKLAIGLGGGGETARHRDAGAGQVGNHFAEGSVLAPYSLDVVHAQLIKPQNVLVHVTPLDVDDLVRDAPS